MSWWESDAAPEIISVFLDGEGPFGDSYQMDSENSGPYGYALINELIPHIEEKYRGTNDAATRYVDGCSTGGWVSLGLQLYYPDTFGGVFSYSPDAIEFENYQLINIYKDENAYFNEFGYKRPVMRSIMGEPMLSLQDFITYENVLSTTNTYVKSGGHSLAPIPLCTVPKDLTDYHSRYSILKQGKLTIKSLSTGKNMISRSMQRRTGKPLGQRSRVRYISGWAIWITSILNPATRAFADFLETTENPKSDAVVEFAPLKGHCENYNYQLTLLKIQEKLSNSSR